MTLNDKHPVCASKIRFNTEAAAQMWINGFYNNLRGKKQKRAALPLYIYQCPHCNNYHTTTQPQRKS